METSRTQEVIELLQERSKEKEAYIGFYDNCIKANRVGLERYALELLKASISEDKKIHPIDIDWIAYDTDYHFQYINLDSDKNSINHFETQNKSIIHTFSIIGLVVICCLCLTLLGIGCLTIIDWLD